MYSESSNIQPVTSVNWEPIEKSSGTTKSTIHFPLSKNGLACRACLALSVTVKQAENIGHITNFIQHCINQITLTSQGRTIVTLDKAALFSIASAAPPSVRAAYEEGCQLVNGALIDKDKTYQYYLDIPMYWTRYLKTSLLTTFNQSMQMNVFSMLVLVLISTVLSSTFSIVILWKLLTSRQFRKILTRAC